MKIQTIDCVFAILKFFRDRNISDNSDLLNPKLWKRKSKSGSSSNIIRIFENSKADCTVTVKSSESEIFSISISVSDVENKPSKSSKPSILYNVEMSNVSIKANDLQYVVCKNHDNITDMFENYEEEGYFKRKFKAGTRIGYIDPDGSKDSLVIIDVTKDIYFYTMEEECYTTDDILVIDLGDGKHINLQEPPEFIENGIEDTGYDEDVQEVIQKAHKEYKFDVFFTSM